MVRSYGVRVFVVAACVACSASVANGTGDAGDAAVADDGGPDGYGGTGIDATSSTPPGTDAGRVACTSTFGTALSIAHARLDGHLVAVVPTNQHACNSDSTHLHLQVAMGGATYDVAVNLDGLVDEIDAPLPRGAWAEGWHTADALDYVSDFKLHSVAFSTTTLAALQQRLETALAPVDQISIFATGYGPDGAHLVHRQGGGRDGAIFLEPTASTSHAFLFAFNTQSF